MLVQVLTRCGLPVAGLIFLCSCSSVDTKTPPPVAAAAPADSEFKSPRVFRAPRVFARPRPVSLTPQETAARSVTRTEQITQLVRAGTLVETGRERLIFSQSRPAKAAPGGLFEDAIVLNRLRGQLKKVAGLPETVVGSATVQGARAYLKINDEIPAELAARAIDSALKTDGVSIVQVSTAPEVQL
jgi:hypothetical protein